MVDLIINNNIAAKNTTK